MKVITQPTKKSHQRHSTKHEIQALLRWTDFDYADFQEDMGYEYLIHEFGRDCPLLKSLVKEKIFWSWWINHWIRRDREFLLKWADSMRDDLVQLYRIHHNPKSVTFKPHQPILRASYARMIGKVIDNLAYD